MKKSIAAVLAALALVFAGSPALADNDTPDTPGTVGVITEQLQYPQWKTDSDNYGDTDSCEESGRSYPAGCAVFPDFGFESMRYVLHYVAQLYEDHANALAKVERQQDRIKAQAAKIAKLKKRLRG